MVDLHSHILYGIDDGAENRETTKRMLHTAQKDGIDVMVATPHYIYGANKYDEEKIIRTYNNVLDIINRDGLDIKLLLGNEIYLDTKVLQNLKRGRCLTLAGSGYVLLEFPMHSISVYTENVIDSLLENGYGVIIAHPERYIPIQKKPGTLYRFIKKGCLIQVNASSVTEKSKNGNKEIVKRFFEKNWVHLVSTDCHSDKNRPPVLSKAYKKVIKWTDKQQADEIFYDNPNKVLSNTFIKTEDAKPVEKNKNFKLFSNIRQDSSVNF